MEENREIINKITDLLDQLAMAYYDEQSQKRRLYYFEALTKVLEFLRTEDEWINTLEGSHDLIALLKRGSLETIHQALFFVEVKGLKHQNYVLDCLVPDGIALLSGYIMAPFLDFDNPQTVLGVNFGVGHFFFNQALMWNNPNLCFLAIENDELIGRYLIEKGLLLKQPLEIKKITDWKNQNDRSDLVIGDMRSEVVINPFQTIIDLENLTNAEASLYLVDADFFRGREIAYFKDQIKHVSQLAAFVLLPDAFFQNERFKKAFLILTKTKKITEMGVFALPNINDSQSLQKTLSDIRAYIKE